MYHKKPIYIYMHIIEALNEYIPMTILRMIKYQIDKAQLLLHNYY